MSVVDCRAIKKYEASNSSGSELITEADRNDFKLSGNDKIVVVKYYDPSKCSRAELEATGSKMVSDNKISDFSIIEKCIFCPATGLRGKSLLYVCKQCERFVK